MKDAERAGRLAPMWGRLAAATGISGACPRLILLTATEAFLAVGAVVVGVVQAVGSPVQPGPPLAVRFAIVAGLAAVAQLARLRMKLASGMVSVAWGEAAVIVGLYLIPAGWLPAAEALGALVALGMLSLYAERRNPFEALRAVSSLTLAAAGAAVVTTALVQPHTTPLTPFVAAGLALGCVVYLAITAGLVALGMSLRYPVAFWPALARTLHSKLLMFVGNIGVGLLVVVMLQADPRWLVLLPPVLWLLQQTYGQRLRADEERRAWQAFAQATRALNQLDERGVASAGLHGAFALFGALEAEIEVVGANGAARWYFANAGGETREGDAPASRSELEVATRPLSVGGVRVGELHVRFEQPPGGRDNVALSAFADALSAALHDAATHRELRLMAARASYEAIHDPLTGLLNRAALLARGDSALRLLHRDQPVALLLLDVDHFKEVNDTLGHAVGDELLQVIAARLGELAGPGELLARLGGDEFALLVTASPTLEEQTGLRTRPPILRYALRHALRRAQQIVERLAAPTEVAGVQLSVEASVGVAVATSGAADMTELLRRADIAMYQAKEGGGSVSSYATARDAASTDQLALLAEMREALAVDDQLVLVLQPAVNLVTGAPTGVEALVRWQHPRRGVLGPVDFVRAVEGSELLAPFTRYVVDKALAIAAEWFAEGMHVPVAVNLSARSLLDPRLPVDVAELLRTHGIPPRGLVLEITETVVMSELDVIDEVLAGLREIGVQLAVDDFGTGYSSLTFLTRIPVDELKVDREFVARMVDSPKAAAIVRTTIELGRELDLRVVAEGVETADQKDALNALGCRAAQGFHFFKPMPPDRIMGVLRNLHAAQPNVVPLRADGAS
jgi:diguanylate cyclase (GGDEF)-like protein